MKPRRCSACSVDVNFADEPHSVSYLAALTESACNSLDDIVGGLCPAHRTMYDRLLKITQETLAAIAAERAVEEN